MSNPGVASPTKRQCTAHLKSGARCKLPPIRGGTVCAKHGGRAPQVKAAAARRLAQAEVAASIADVAVTPIDNPLEALADLAAQSKAWMEHLANTVAQLGDQYRFTDDKSSEQLDARVALLERAMDRLQKYLVDWVRLGFDERTVALQERQVDLIDRVMTAVLDAVFVRLEAGESIAAVREALPVIERAAIETTAKEAR